MDSDDIFTKSIVIFIVVIGICVVSSCHHVNFSWCRQYLATFMNLCQCLPLVGHFWQLLTLVAIFGNFWQLLMPVQLATLTEFYILLQLLAKHGNVCQLCRFWQLLTTFGNLYYPVVLSSCHPVILSYCHLYILSFCPFAILSVWQPVNMSARQFCSLWSFQLAHLGACFTY